jgi:RimJ/RimL family protein N-acetyltransferase
MSLPAGLELREVEASDIETFHRHRLDPASVRVAAFVGTGASDKAAFIAHWERNLRASENTHRTILFEGRIAGHIACFRWGGDLEVTYWLGREHWGRGLATGALQQLLRLVPERPIHARAAADNLGSIRVLRKCGFEVVGGDRGFAQGRGEVTEEVHLRLDREPADV